MKYGLLAFLFFSIVGCAGQPEPHTFRSQFAAPSIPDELYGEYTIKGSSLLRQKNGSTITCAGEAVTIFPLLPLSYYEKEFLELPEIDKTASYNYFSEDIRYNNYVLGLKKVSMTTACDPVGKFEFEKIPSGRYFISTKVTWYEGKDEQGGMVGGVVEIMDGSRRKDVSVVVNDLLDYETASFDKLYINTRARYQ